MPIYISLLRGINVGGNRRVKMVALRELLASLGIAGAQTLLQSGNVVFQHQSTDAIGLAQRIEEGIEEALGFHSTIIMRSADAFREAMGKNPFVGGGIETNKLLVMFLASTPEAEAIEDLLSAHTGPEDIQILGQEVHLYYPNGMGRSKLSNAWIERKLRVEGTARNWNTITKIQQLAEDFEDN